MRKKIVLLDSDVISHFIAAGKIDDLNKILSPHILMIVRQVYEESSYHPFFEDRKMELDEWINRYHIRIIEFPYDNENIKLEFYRIKKENPRFGKGERACMAIAKYEKQVIASSNFKDVAEYCEINGIEYIGLMDIMLIALRKHIYTVEMCNKFIHDVTVINDARLPVDDISRYKSDKDLDGF